MYILYVLTRSDEIGGAQIHVRDMAEAMYKYGNKVTVAVGGDGPLIDQLMYRGIYWHYSYSSKKKRLILYPYTPQRLVYWAV
jgi:hypothetical protein